MSELLLGLLAGVGFGFIMQKSRILRFEKQIGFLLLRDMTFLKFFLTAIIVGMIGCNVLHSQGLLAFSHKDMNVAAVLAGGTLFGAGWALCGYCPGTAVATLGEGHWRVVFVLAGMLVGAFLYGEALPWLRRTVLTWRNYSDLSLPQALDMSVPTVIALVTGIFVTILWLVERKGL